MNRSWSFALLVLVLGSLATPARAELLFPKAAVDAGEVRSGPVLAQSFPFINRGKESVEITSLRASCGCMTPRLDQRVYQAGEGGTLRVEVNTLSQAPGPHTWRVEVGYRSGTNTGQVSLHLTARLNAEVTAEPGALTISTDQGAAPQILLLDRRAKPLTITAVRGSSDRLKGQVLERYRDVLNRTVSKIKLEVAADYPDGRHEESIGIYSDDPDYRELRVQITIVKRPRQRVAATPGQVTLLVPAGQPAPSKMVLIRDREDQEVVVDSITADDPAITCTWARGPRTMATLKIRVDQTRIKDGRLDSAVHVRIRQPVEQTLTIPVKCSLP